LDASFVFGARAVDAGEFAFSALSCAPTPWAADDGAGLEPAGAPADVPAPTVPAPGVLAPAVLAPFALATAAPALAALTESAPAGATLSLLVAVESGLAVGAVA